MKDEPSLLRLARAGDAEEGPPQPVDLATRVRALRKDRGWTLEQAAQAAGLARSTLSKIENGQMSPTYEALKKLAQGLDISVPQLFTPPSEAQITGRMAVTRRARGRPTPPRPTSMSFWPDTLTRKAMLPYRARIRARRFEEFDGWVRHDGEEFLYVLTGRVRLFTEFYAPVDLSRGDSAYYDAAMGHNVVSISDDDATILWVTSRD
jgi:transcriptional regulator with XRE-family HTH domain